MAKTKISELDAAAANNTDINSVDVSEGCAPSGINNAIREMGAMLKRMDNGTDHLTNPNITGDLDVDNINIDGNTISSTDTNGNVTVDPNGTGQINLSANVDVTGTVTADGLGVGIASPAYDAHIHESDSGNSLLHFTNATTGTTGSDGFTVGLDASEQAILLHRENTSMVQYTNGTQRLRLENNGDISFYADDGTTQGLFWDASTQRLGLGSTSPSALLTVEDTDAEINVVGTRGTGATHRIFTGGANSQNLNAFSAGDFYLNADNQYFRDTSSNVRVAITSGGSVGIGTAAPTRNLVVSSTDPVSAIVSTSTAGTGQLVFGDPDDDNRGRIYYDHTSDSMRFYTSASEKVRIDDAGNLLVGTTSPVTVLRASTTEEGIAFQPNGQFAMTAAETTAGVALGYFNRRSTDGQILQFRKDGAEVGSIGVNSNDLVVHSSPAGHSGLRFGNGYIIPTDNTGSTASSDNSFDLGLTGTRFKDLYLSGGAYLGGTAAANKLDSYEEGTWTPAYTADTTDFTSVTYDVVEGEYVKIGDVVHINMTLRTDALSGGSGNVRITGLPFSPSVIASATISDSENFTTNPTRAYFTSTNTSIVLDKQTTFNGNTTQLTASDMGTGTNDNLIRLSGFYILS